MLMVIALGGNALLKHGEAVSAEAQRNNVRMLPHSSRRQRPATTSSSCMATDRRLACSRSRRAASRSTSSMRKRKA